jgi:protocatechuate 3,4-dioxygenase beta subunit
VYSGVSGAGSDTGGQTFLRGYQVTDANGVAKFVTIVPGWYMGRTVHIHFKIRYPANTDQAWEFTSQLFFEPTFTGDVFAQAPYASKGQQDTTNARDGIYGNGGDQTLLAVTDSGSGGYATTFDIALDLSDVETGQSDAAGGGPGGG